MKSIAIVLIGIAALFIALALVDRCWPVRNKAGGLAGAPWRNAVRTLRRRLARLAEEAGRQGQFATAVDSVGDPAKLQHCRNKAVQATLVGALWLALACTNFALLAQVADFLVPGGSKLRLPLAGRCSETALALSFVLIAMTMVLSVWIEPLLVRNHRDRGLLRTKLAAAAASLVVVLETGGAFVRGAAGHGTIGVGGLNAAIAFLIVGLDLLTGAFAWEYAIGPASLVAWARCDWVLLRTVIGALWILCGDEPRVPVTQDLVLLGKRLRLLRRVSPGVAKRLRAITAEMDRLAAIVECSAYVADEARFKAELESVADEARQVLALGSAVVAFTDSIRLTHELPALYGVHHGEWVLNPSYRLTVELPEASLSTTDPDLARHDAFLARQRMASFLDGAAAPLARLSERVAQLIARLAELPKTSVVTNQRAALQARLAGCHEQIDGLADDLAAIRREADRRFGELSVAQAERLAETGPEQPGDDPALALAQLKADLAFLAEVVDRHAAAAQECAQLVTYSGELETALAGLAQPTELADGAKPLSEWHTTLERIQRQLDDSSRLFSADGGYPTRQALLERLAMLEERLLHMAHAAIATPDTDDADTGQDHLQLVQAAG